MVYLGGALGVNTFLMYGFFNTIPVSIDEAAKIDGAGHARIFFTMILRLVAPILAVVFLLSFIASFNDYVIASVILIQPENQTLAVGLIKLVSNPRYADWPRVLGRRHHGGDPGPHRVPLRCSGASSAG